jgi:hypothetical protein
LAMLESNPLYEASQSSTKVRVYGLVMHCYAPIESCSKGLLEGYNDGMAVGDTENAFFNLVQYLETSFNLGKNLHVLNKDLEVYCEQMKVYNQWQQFTLASIIRNVLVSKLLGDIGSDTSEKIQTDNRTKSALSFKKFMISAWLDNDVEAATHAMKLQREESNIDMSHCVSDVDFMEAMVAVVCFGAARKTRSKIYLKAAWRARRNIQFKTRKGNPNYMHLESLIEAEWNAYRGRTEIAKLKYQAAVSFSGRKGQINIQGLSSERYGDYMKEIGDLDEATYRWTKALDLYEEWGAMAKVDQVREKLQ